MSGNREPQIVEPDPERDRGILTPHDRAFLLSSDSEGVREQMADTAERQKRYNIRRRFRNALIDMQYLLLLDEDIRELFPDQEWDPNDVGAIHGSVLAAVYYLIRAEVGQEVAVEEFTSTVEDEIRFSYATEHQVYLPDGDVETRISDPDTCPSLQDILEEYLNGKDIPESAHQALDYGGLHPHPEDYSSKEERTSQNTE